MLIIRKTQMDVLHDYMLKKFEDDMVIHLNRYFRQACETLGEENLRQKIRYGFMKAEEYGFQIENDVSRYLNLMFTFGWDFDTDKDLLWASDILANEDIISTKKMNELYKEAAKHISDSTRT